MSAVFSAFKRIFDIKIHLLAVHPHTHFLCCFLLYCLLFFTFISEDSWTSWEVVGHLETWTQLLLKVGKCFIFWEIVKREFSLQYSHNCPKTWPDSRIEIRWNCEGSSIMWSWLTTKVFSSVDVSVGTLGVQDNSVRLPFLPLSLPKGYLLEWFTGCSPANPTIVVC